MKKTLWSSIFAATFLFVAASAFAARKGEGSDLEIGGPGSAPGQFLSVQDFTFDSQNHLYVLEGQYFDQSLKKRVPGNCRVQIFTDDGKPIRQISVRDPDLGDKNAPARLAVDRAGDIWVTQPAAGLVDKFSPAGELLNKIQIPGAQAITVRAAGPADQLVVVPVRRQRNEWVGMDELPVISAGGLLGQPIKLSQPIADCQDLTSDQAGNLYMEAQENQLYKFTPDGKLLLVIGAGTKRRAEDGSELQRTVAVDSHGNIYGNSYGNPTFLSRFDPTVTTVSQSKAQFHWADAWGSGLVLRVDHHDRLWAAVMGDKPGDAKYHYRPCVLRVEPGYLEENTPGVVTKSSRLLGLNLSVTNSLPYGVANELKPATVELVVGASNRQVNHLDVTWVVNDFWKQEITSGRFSLALTNGVETRQAISVTPPRWGWYTVNFFTADKGVPLMGVGGHLGFTPKYPGMPELTAGISHGGWVDPVRQAFAGLPFIRLLSETKPGPQLDQMLDDIATYHLTPLVLFGDKAHCEPAHIREVVERYKGRVHHYEIVNEPNFSMKPEDYVALLKQAYAAVKSVDPSAQVLGPDVCSIQLPWYEAFYRDGGGKYVDILSVHDYEGNESIDPGHWVWKYGELRKLMARYGDDRKPIWQTERAISGLRGHSFTPGVQAVRFLLWRDLLETLGIPAEHSHYYYLNEGGYKSVATYLWSADGPHPAALASRTRQAMIAGRRYVGQLDFGPTGNQIFMGLRYVGADGETLTLRNYGTLNQTLELGVTGGNTVQQVDAFGNPTSLPVQAGKIKLTVTMLPLYLRLALGQQVTAPPMNFGRNYATEATFQYSAPFKGDATQLNDGIFEAPHAGNPHRKPWAGDFPSAPQTLEIQFPQPRSINHAVVFSMRADNANSALLDYDLQYDDGKDWVTLQTVRTPLPPSDVVNTKDAWSESWYLDQNFFINDFPMITTRRLRLVARRTTFGFLPDEIAATAARWPTANGMQRLMLREIELFGPVPEIELTTSFNLSENSGVFASESVRLVVSNRSGADAKLSLQIHPPKDWIADPVSAPIFVQKGGSTVATVNFQPPPELPTGRSAAWVELQDAAGRVVDTKRLLWEIAPSVELTPHPAQVTIKNVSTNSIIGTVELSVSGTTSRSEFGPLAAGHGTNIEFAVAGGATNQATYRVTVDHLVTEAIANFPAPAK